MDNNLIGINKNVDEKGHLNKVEITVKYVAGNFTDQFNKNQTVKHVFDKAIDKFQIDSSVAGKLGLFNSNTGTLLDMGATLESQNIGDKTVLILSTVQNGDVEG